MTSCSPACRSILVSFLEENIDCDKEHDHKFISIGLSIHEILANLGRTGCQNSQMFPLKTLTGSTPFTAPLYLS